VDFCRNRIDLIHRLASVSVFMQLNTDNFSTVAPPAAFHTTLELVSCVMVVIRFSMDVAGVFRYYEDSGPAGMALCILFHGGNLIAIGSFGARASVVIHTLDSYWKIVHPIKHRKYYRRWMLHAGLVLPWLSGITVKLIPAIGTTRIVRGLCRPTSYWPSASMNVVGLCSASLSEIYLQISLITMLWMLGTPYHNAVVSSEILTI